MGKVLLLFFALYSGTIFGQLENKNEEIIYKEVDVKAYYPSFSKFLFKNIDYPMVAIERGLQGNCEISFIVHSNGELSDFVVLKGVDGCIECDQEALRVLKKSKKWIPAEFEGKKVSSVHIETISFVIM